MKKTILIIVAIILVIVAGIILLTNKPSKQSEILTAHYSGTNASTSILVDSIAPGDFVSSPLNIAGKARGWYFEGSFPVSLVDGDGLIIASGIAQAKGDWMTSEFVPFEVQIVFVKPANASAFGNRGSLILKKDNPSGMPAYDASIEIPVKFK